MGVPTTVGDYESIGVVVERLTKSGRYITVWVKCTVQKLAKL